MGGRSLSFKIITSISIMVALILFCCVYCITMINKTQTYAQDTATSWLPSIEAFGRINLQIGNLSRRAVLVIADSVAGQKERLEKNTEDLNKFKTTLDKELNDYITNGLIGPGEKPFYDETMAAYKEYIKSYEEEFAMVKEGKGVEALNHYNTVGRPLLFKLIEKVTKETAFNAEGAEGSTKQGSNLTSITNWTMTIVLICSVIISTIIIIVILRLTNAIRGSIESLKKQGDSTMKISKVLMQNSQSLSESVTEQAASVH
jgi:hypothetical protein